MAAGSADSPGGVDLCPRAEHVDYGTELILGDSERPFDDFGIERFAAEMIDEFDGCQACWVLLPAFGIDLDLKGREPGSHLPAQQGMKCATGAGGEAGHQHLKGCGIRAGSNGVIHWKNFVANVHIHAHIANVYGADGKIGSHTTPNSWGREDHSRQEIFMLL